MNLIATPAPPTAARPTGFVQPTHERAIRAIAARLDGRARDARQNIEAVPEDARIHRAWKCFLDGLLALDVGDSPRAASLLLQAVATAMILDLSADGRRDAPALRLAAAALESLGFLDRRRERCEDAYSTHLAAYRLRSEHGSLEEMWESAISLGLDADLARRYDQAQGWYRTAIEHAELAAEEPAKKQAAGWSHLALSLMESGRHEASIGAARSARQLWHECAMEAVEAAKADMLLGRTLLKQGESLFESDPRRAGELLAEAVDALHAAREDLLAFGAEFTTDADTCRDLSDYTDRLQASLTDTKSAIS